MPENHDDDKTRSHAPLKKDTDVWHYRIVEKIGAGGMGEVYLAEDTKLKRQVALKFLPANMCADENCRNRFKREAQAIAAIKHPNIVTIYEVSEFKEQPFFAMEHVEGESLYNKIKEKKISINDAIDLTKQICEGLQEAHEAGIVHRDIKPSNIILDKNGRPKILDFGLATILDAKKLTKTGSTLGTIGYMSPEQVNGEKVDARSDLFSVGVILYEMITGQRPFQAVYEAAIMNAILHEAPEPLSRYKSGITGGLQQIVNKALEKNPETRYQHADEMLADLKRLQIETAPFKKNLTGYWVAAAAVVIAIMGFFLSNKFLFDGREAKFGWSNSIAVLIFRDQSPNKDQDYFCEGMTDAIIGRLSGIQNLKVISLTSVLMFKDPDRNLKKIGKSLGVDYILEGSIQKENDSIRVRAQLIDVIEDAHIWSEHYDQELKGIFAVQDDISKAIVDAMKIELLGDEEVSLTRRETGDVEAYELYLKGMFNIHQFTQEGFDKGLAYLHQAIEKDPTDPLQYARLALAYTQIGHGPGAPPEAYPRAEAAALRALELDETVAEAHAALAEFKLYYEWDWEGAELAFQRAFQLNPNLARAHSHYAWYLLLFGRVDEALAEQKRAKELDPLTPLWSVWLGWLYYWGTEQYQEAIYEARKSLELNPNFPCGLYIVGDVYATQGMYEEAIAMHQKAAAVSSFWGWGLGRAYALSGQKDEARKIAAEMKKAKRKDVWGLAEIYTALGEKEEALRWLEEGYKTRRDWMPWIGKNTNFKPLHSDPGFQDLLRRLNLPE